MLMNYRNIYKARANYRVTTQKMNNKILTLAILGILMASLVYALSIQISPTTPLGFTKSQTSKNFTITNTGSTGSESIDITLPDVDPITSNGNTATFTLQAQGSLNNLAPGESATVSVLMEGSFGLFDLGEYLRTFQVTATNSTDDSITSPVNLKYISSFCDNGPVGVDLEISDVSIKNIDGEDDDEWFLLDDIEVEVEVENLNEDDDVKEVFIELGFFDSNGRDRAKDLDFESTDDEKFEIGRIKNDDSETHIFEFRVPADFDEGNYKLAVKAYSKDVGESNLCVDSSLNSDLSDDFFGKIDVELETDEDKLVVVDDIILPTEATCGENVLGSLKVFNVGDDDQDRVKVTIFNSQLKLDLEEEIRSGLDIGDGDSVEFSFIVPNNLQDKLYPIEIKTEYDYRNGVYREFSEDTWNGFLKVIGCSVSPGPGPITGGVIITPSLQSEAKAGKELVVGATFVNADTEERTYSVNAKAYESWADLNSISQRLITLSPGGSITVNFVLDVHSDALGANSFIIETVSSGVTEVQEVEVNIAGADGSDRAFDFGEGNLIWVIVAVNVLLIILIIIVAVRISRR